MRQVLISGRLDPTNEHDTLPAMPGIVESGAYSQLVVPVVMNNGDFEPLVLYKSKKQVHNT